MILDWLAQEFNDLFSRDNRARVALWCDAKAEFSGILSAIEGRFASKNLVLLAFNKTDNRGALWLKWAIEVGLGAGKKVVLWIPYSRDDLAGAVHDGTRLDCLLEYAYCGLIWLIEGKPPTLFGFLKKHGVPLPTKRAEQDPLWRGGCDSPLAKYVCAHINRNNTFWTSRILSLAVIEESILGNLEERLLRFLTDPAREWDQLEKACIAKEFSSQMNVHYAETSKIDVNPQAWAEEFVESLVMLEIYDATGEPGDFPFPTKLPQESLRPPLREFLHFWMMHRDYLESYRYWALQVEKTTDLFSWANKKSGRPQALRSLAVDRWMKFLKGLKELGGGAASIEAYLQEHEAEAVEESKGFWAKGTGEIPGWELVLKLVEMVERVNKSIQVAATLKTAEETISSYVAYWHEIDLTHWQLCCAARKAEEMELIVSVADRFYARYLDETGRAFYETFRDEGKWPPSGCKSVSEVVAGLFNDPTVKRAIIIVDALRFDLAANLRKKLGEGSLDPYVANVPSETHVGMASLLPQANVRVAIENGKLQLLSEAAGGDLCYRSYRWKLLETAGAAALGKDKKGGLRDEIRYLWDLVDPPKNLPRVLVLFDRGVDEIGHDLGNEAILHFEELLSDLERAIRKLRSWGYLEIHVLTDHGFILMQTSGDVPLMEVEKDRFALLSSRYGILKTGETVASAVVPFPLDQNWSVALPPGLRSFSAPGKFFHGGATLQEVVLPHLKFVMKAARSRMRVRVLVPQVEIYTMAVKVELVPEKPIPDTFFTEEPEAIKVDVFLGSADAPRSNTKIIEIGPNLKDSLSVTLILNREPAISAGTEIPVQVIDTDKESYAMGLFVRAARDLG